MVSMRSLTNSLFTIAFWFFIGGLSINTAEFKKDVELAIFFVATMDFADFGCIY